MFEKELWELEGVYRKALLELDLEEEEVKPGLLILMEEMVEINRNRDIINRKLEELMEKKAEARNEWQT